MNNAFFNEKRYTRINADIQLIGYEETPHILNEMPPRVKEKFRRCG
jgi:hypothetical protein